MNKSTTTIQSDGQQDKSWTKDKWLDRVVGCFFHFIFASLLKLLHRDFIHKKKKKIYF